MTDKQRPFIYSSDAVSFDDEPEPDVNTVISNDNNDDDWSRQVESLLDDLEQVSWSNLRPDVDQIRHEALQEREQARKWASDMRAAVQEWMKQQKMTKQLPSNAQQHAYQQAIEQYQQNIQALRDELKTSLEHFLKVESQLHDIIRTQQRRIQELERNKENDKPNKTAGGKYVDDLPHVATPAKQLSPSSLSNIHITPFTNNKDDNNKKKPTSLRKRRNESGTYVTEYSNGAQKQVFPDGTIVIRFANGDIQTQHQQSTAYYHQQSGVIQVSQPDGSTIWEFPSGQMERHWTDGRKLVRFPDGSFQRIQSNGTAQDVDPDQQVVLMSDMACDPLDWWGKYTPKETNDNRATTRTTVG